LIVDIDCLLGEADELTAGNFVGDAENWETVGLFASTISCSACRFIDVASGSLLKERLC
jgi:hypothetical protein